jgi:hypothetical protein
MHISQPPVPPRQVTVPAITALRASGSLLPLPLSSPRNATPPPAVASALPLPASLALSEDCRRCALLGSLRPRAVLREALRGSPVDSGRPMVCLKVKAKKNQVCPKI